MHERTKIISTILTDDSLDCFASFGFVAMAGFGLEAVADFAFGVMGLSLLEGFKGGLERYAFSRDEDN